MADNEWDDHVAAMPPSPPWHRLLQEEQGKPLSNLANATTAFRQAPELVGILKYDEMQRHIVLTRNPPGIRHDKATPRPIQDADIDAIQEWLQRNGLKRVGKDVVLQAVNVVAQEHAYHPVRDYLTGVTWDGVHRLDTWISTYLGAEPNEYHRVIGRLFLISMVARVMEPGCKADYMLVLQGPQGAYKSTACAILGGPWFSDNLPALDSADHVRLSMHLRGKWLIEVAELSSFGKAETNRLKEFLSQTVERYLPKFARNEVQEQRQCVMIGTTNKPVFLKDETGGRRFWPVICGDINIDALTRDRDMLFSEAFYHFISKEVWSPNKSFEDEYIKPEQEKHFEIDEWENSIGMYLGGKWKVTVGDVARDALQFANSRLGTADQRRITAIMERLGWERGPRNGTAGQRYWLFNRQ